jgi:hypothetical protein
MGIFLDFFAAYRADQYQSHGLSYILGDLGISEVTE